MDTNKRVLLVDDDIDIRESMGVLLEGEYDVECAANGRQALEKLDEGDFDAVVLDLRMPEMDGAEFMLRLRLRDAQIPVILVSAGINLPHQCETLGATEWLAKPFDVPVFEQTLHRIVMGTEPVALA